MISPVIWGTHTEPQSLFLSALAEIKDQKQYLLAANNVNRLSMLPSPPCTPSPPAKRLQGEWGTCRVEMAKVQETVATWALFSSVLSVKITDSHDRQIQLSEKTNL